MKRYHVIHAHMDDFTNQDRIVFGIGLEGGFQPLIRDFSSREVTEKFVNILNENETSYVHFWEIAEDFLL
ncbi:MAG: hypothetical protein LBJ12_01460 [Oscillospiraceae bacterium]|jgi:hypothetical protein|nr:hypothetical protein [Oscillospiraceae bacterium]